MGLDKFYVGMGRTGQECLHEHMGFGVKKTASCTHVMPVIM